MLTHHKELPQKSLCVSQSWPLALAWIPGHGGPAAAARGAQLEQEHRADPAGPHGFPKIHGNSGMPGKKMLGRFDLWRSARHILVVDLESRSFLQPKQLSDSVFWEQALALFSRSK